MLKFLIISLVVITCYGAPPRGRSRPKSHGGRVVPWEPGVVISDADYPCVQNGYFAHPGKCTRFYRCVDFTFGRKYFSRYLFECPQGTVYSDAQKLCIRGSCVDSTRTVDTRPADESSENSEEVSDISKSQSHKKVNRQQPNKQSAFSYIKGKDGSTTDGTINLATVTNYNPTPIALDSLNQAENEQIQKLDEPKENIEIIDEISVKENPVETPIEKYPAVEKPVDEQPVQQKSDVHETHVPETPAEKVTTEEEQVKLTSIDEVLTEIKHEETKDVAEPAKLNTDTLPVAMDEIHFVQNSEYCDLFHPELFDQMVFSCKEGLGFDEANQVCRSAGHVSALCKDKKILNPNSNVFREHYKWTDIGVVEFKDGKKMKANPFYFIDASKYSNAQYPQIQNIGDMINDFINKRDSSKKNYLVISGDTSNRRKFDEEPVYEVIQGPKTLVAKDDTKTSKFDTDHSFSVPQKDSIQPINLEDQSLVSDYTPSLLNLLGIENKNSINNYDNGLNNLMNDYYSSYFNNLMSQYYQSYNPYRHQSYIPNNQIYVMSSPYNMPANYLGYQSQSLPNLNTHYSHYPRITPSYANNNAYPFTSSFTNNNAYYNPYNSNSGMESYLADLILSSIPQNKQQKVGEYKTDLQDFTKQTQSKSTMENLYYPNMYADSADVMSPMEMVTLNAEEIQLLRDLGLLYKK